MYEQGGNHLASILSVDKSVSTDLAVRVGVCINNSMQTPTCTVQLLST